MGFCFVVANGHTDHDTICKARLEFDAPGYPATSAILLAMRFAADLTGSLARWA